jgi:hypothetical protein
MEDLERLLIVNNTFQNNFATHYGDTFAAIGVRLKWVKKMPLVTLYSGEGISPFSVMLHDVFGQAVEAFSLSNFIYLAIKLVHREHSWQQGAVLPYSKSPMFSKSMEFKDLRLVAYPDGPYILTIYPISNYDKSRVFLSANITINPCISPKEWLQVDGESHLSCVDGNFKGRSVEFLFIDCN